MWQNVKFLYVKPIKRHCAFCGTRRGIILFARVVPSSSPEPKNQSKLTHLVLTLRNALDYTHSIRSKKELVWTPRPPWHRISVWAVCGIFMKFGMAVAYKILPRTREYPENRRSDSHKFLGRKWISSRTVHIFWPICMKIGVEDFHVMTLIDYEFRENGGSQTTIL